MKLLSHVQLFVTPWTVACQAPLSMGSSRQEYWSGLPFPSPGDLSNPGIKLWPPALQADSLPSEPPENQYFAFFLWGNMPLITCEWTFSLFLISAYYLPSCYKHLCASFCGGVYSHLFGVNILLVELLCHMVTICSTLPPNCFLK